MTSLNKSSRPHSNLRDSNISIFGDFRSRDQSNKNKMKRKEAGRNSCMIRQASITFISPSG